MAKPDYCPVCHMNRNDDHPRDGTYKCWCHECDYCDTILPEGADFICDPCKEKGEPRRCFFPKGDY